VILFCVERAQSRASHAPALVVPRGIEESDITMDEYRIAMRQR